MRQFLRKSALVAVLSAVALCGSARQAAAVPVVTPNGLGDLLIFGYWTAYDRDTLVAITNTFGGQSQRYVHVRIREGVNSNEVANFTICLSPGDVWTAAITSTGRNASTSSLLIGDPGTCDGSVTNAQGLTPPPAPGDPPLGLNADFGYIEAYTLECNSPVLAPGCPASPQAPFGNNNGGDDTIMGTATLVSATAGFSSSYNATSLVGFDAFNETANLRSPNGAGTVRGLGSRTNVANALANEGGVAKEILLGRWTASTLFNSSTDVVITFPTGDQLRSANILGQPIADPVSIWIFDERENFNFSPRTIIIDWEVNICRFQNANETDTHNTQFTCNGTAGLGGVGSDDVAGPGGTFDGGWFRIINNNDYINGGIGDGTGVEFDNINAIPDSSFPVIGLVFSFFQGVNGIFDQAYPIQWAAITGLGGIGGATCQIFPFTGCNAFAISSEFQPHTLPNGMVLPVTDTSTGRNRRSNSGIVD
jgi:hypothetical protein